MTDKKYNGQTELILQEIVDVMRAGNWVRGKSGPVFAEKHGLSVSYMKHLAAEAWNRVKAEVTNPTEVRDNIAVALVRIAKKAENGADYRSATGALKTLAEVTGAKPPEKSEIHLTGEATPAAARKVMSELFPLEESKPDEK